jgi:hypothetical protein
MIDVHALLERQEQWQKARRHLSWSEKMRMVQAVRDSVRKLMATRAQSPETAPKK